MSPRLGYVDLQVNGFAGIDFNSDELTAEQVRRVCEALSARGTDAFLATLITDQVDLLESRLSRWADWIESDSIIGRHILGIHLEGPFLNPAAGFIGAHPPQHAIPASLPVIQRLESAAQGWIKLVTLAPEIDSQAKVTRWLAKNNICVAAGHTDASLDQFRQAMDQGLSGFTHLGNGCPQSLARHDNVIQRVLFLADQLWVSLIIDGIHIPLHVVQNYLRVIPPERTILISDTTAAGGLGPGRHKLGRCWVQVDPTGAARLESAPEYLAGSTITLDDAVQLAVNELGIDSVKAHSWARHQPLALIR